MNKRKKTRAKKSAPEQRLWTIVLGWFLVFLSVLLWIALLSYRYTGEAENYLGPYFGELFPSVFLVLFGKVSALIFSVALFLIGLFLVFNLKKRMLAKLSLGFLALSFTVSFLLSLRIYTEIHPEKVVLIKNGGLVGSFITQDLIRPIFTTSPIVPFILGLLSMILIAVLAFGLRAKHFLFLKVILKKTFTIVKKMKPQKADPLESTKAALKDNPKSIKTSRSPKTIQEFTIIQTGKAVPFKAESKWAKSMVQNPLEVDQIEEGIALNSPREDEIALKEKYLTENASRLGVLEKRELRDEIAKLKLAQEQNQWEDQRSKNLDIKGIVRRENNLSAESPEKTKVEVHAQSTLEKNALDSKEDFISPEAEDDSDPKYNETTIVAPVVYDEYKIPKVDEILAKSPKQTADYSEEELKEIAASLERQLENFKVKGKVVGISTGPLVTRFEIEPGPGVKVARFSALQEDLALALKAVSIRILAPIPGKSLVGIEVPNRKMQIVYTKDILESGEFKPKSNKILIVLGKDILGNPFTMDLAKAPHVLIAGQTGSGKSVCINVLMASILFSKSPDDLRLILVDPKVVELKLYEKIPHLLHEVVTQPEEAVKALQWACVEMDRRYEVLAKAKVRNIAGFNAKIEKGDISEELSEEERTKMYFLVIVIDELADLMMVAGKEVETSIARIAQKARAVGIHLVLATQRPSVNVITGLIKANLPTRISFKVTSQIDARTIMDKAGAEKLLGRGDMLFRATEDPEPHRVHGAFLTDSEAEKLAEACSNQNVNYPRVDTFDMDDDKGVNSPDKASEYSPIIVDVLEWCKEGKGVSISAIQRSFGVGFSHAGRIMDQLIQLGVSSKNHKGSKPREILLLPEEIDNIIRQLQSQ